MGKHSETIHKINRSKSDTDKKQGKKMRRWGLRSCLALLLAATVTSTTIYSQVLYAQAETGEVPDGRISFTFQPLEKAPCELETKGTQEETLKQLGLPETLTITTQSGSAVPDPVKPDTPEEDITDVSGNTPDTGAAETDAAETTPDLDAAETDAAETTDGSDIKDSEDPSGSDAEGTDAAETTDGSDVIDSGDPSGSDVEGTDFSEDANGSNVQDPVGASDADAAGTDSSKDSTTVLSVTVPDTPVNSAPEEAPVEVMTLENNGDSDVTNNNPGDNTDPDKPADPPVSQAFSELPVTWSCDHYEEIRDSYLFTPKWDEKAYRYDGKPEEIPVITVTFKDIPGIHRVSSEDELKAAFQIENLPADGSEFSIVLMNDIALTGTLNVPVLPAGAKVILESKADVDGSGRTKYCSLIRGSIDSETDSGTPIPFTGAMLHFGTSEVSQTTGDIPMPFAADQNAGGTLTLRNITIDGKRSAGISDPFSSDNQVNAPAIISSGHLILGKGASIINNYNYGTYLTDGEGKIVPDENGVNRYAVPPCGGGIWVCGGALELQKGCRIQFNAAGLRGGGIYLDTGAVLHCYTEAEALTGNSVFTGGAGGDLYACPGSTIYYDPAVFIPWNSFYIDPAAAMIPVGSAALDTTTPIEIYLHVGEDSGYSYQEVKEKLESTFGDRVTVLLPQTYMIDTTDLRNWYVYDHYDTNCWNQADANRNSIPDSWEQAYREYRHRPYYGYTPQYTTASVKENEISAWLKNPPLKYSAGFGKDCLALAPLKEHLYSRTENGKPEMTFVGYDRLPNVDFLFYNPQSDGQKTVEFDVDSSNVNTHTLAGTGFLLNTGISEGNLLSGYLLYYTYQDGGTAQNISLYRFSDVDIDTLHNGSSTGISMITSNAQLVKTYTIDTGKWESRMSIKIIVDSDKITVTQRPKDKLDASAETFIWDNIEDTGFNGFGPLVAYSSHACFIASSFTYSNLRMQFVNPDREKNLLSPLTEADFSQQGGVKRYYLNLLGESESMAYADESGTEFGDQYHEFLYMMQDEGIGLITDAKTPFAKYLGPTNISPNLFEVPNPDKKADLNALIVNLRTYLSMYPTTELPENLNGTGLERAHATKPVGNIWLAGANNVQLPRVMNANALPPNYIVNIMDIACDLSGKGYTASYSLKKPGSSEYEELPPLGGGSENAAVSFSRSGGIGASFVITNDPVEWPAGQYTVKQTVRQIDGDESAISGYSYFTLTRSSLIEDPSVIPPAEPSAVNTSSTGSSTGGSGGSAPVLAAPEITAPDVVQPTVTSDGASQPKTGDGMFPAMPVACGACTAFMMKIMLWMYDVDFDIITEHKEELVRSLILWGKGSARPRIYMAIVALTAVITAYHLLKAFVANSKQIVRERLGI